MLRLAILSARGRLATFTGALLAFFAASVLAVAWGMQLESILRTHPPVERYAAATAVVTGQQQIGADHDVLLSERARVSSALGARLAVVAGYPAALGSRLSLASTEPAGTVTVVGVARPEHPVSEQASIFVTDAEATRLAGHPGRVDAIGILAAPGVDLSRVRAAAGGAAVFTGDARGQAEYPELQATRTTLIPVTTAFALHTDGLPAAAVIGCAVATALLTVLSAGRRAARAPPTLALTDAAVEPRLLGPGRIIGGLLAIFGAIPLFTVATTTSTPETAAATSEMTALFLVVAVGFLGPIAADLTARVLARPLAALSPVGGFLASANLGASTRRFASASTPLVLTVALSCTLLFSTTTIEHATSQERHAGLTGQLAVTSTGPGLPAAALADVRATRGVRSAVALTATTLGPGLGAGDTVPAQILAGGQGGGLDVGVTAGSLGALHGDAIALGRHRASSAHAHVGDRVAIMLGDGTRTHATVVAIYRRDLAFGDGLLAPELAAGHQTTPLLGTVLVQTDDPAAVTRRLEALAPRYPGLRVNDRASLATATDADREMNRWFGPQFVAEIFVFTSIAVVNTLLMIALRRRRELGLLRHIGATARQVRSMARWEAILIITIGLGLGLAIAAIALLPLSHALNGGLPYVPVRPFAAIVGATALLALLALLLPTRRLLRTPAVEAIGIGE
jgi:putative ABC transport system permease protein